MSPLARRVQDEGDSILGSGRAENPVWKFTERVYEIRYLDTTPLPGSAPTVYVPDWGGKLWAVSAATGQAIWSRTIASYDGIPGDVSRTSPAYYDGELVIGTGANRVSALRGAYVVGIDARTGAMLWRTRVDANLAAIVTGSPTADDGTKTTTGGGFFEALNAATGAIDWQVADPQGRFVDDSFVSSANGVMYAGSAAASGPDMYALDGTTGQIQWRYASGGAVWAGAAIVSGAVYWGTGYHTEGFGYHGDHNKLYAFTLTGR